MTIDKSLKLQSRLRRARNVLSRAERVAELRDSGRWKEGESIFGLPKVRVRRARRRPKAAKVEAAEAAAAGPEAPAPESPEDKTDTVKK